MVGKRDRGRSRRRINGEYKTNSKVLCVWEGNGRGLDDVRYDGVSGVAGIYWHCVGWE